MSGSNNSKSQENIVDEVYNFSIEYYTNIPNDKVHNLNFKDIQYSNEPNNSGSSQDKLYYSKSKYVNLETISGKNDVKTILTNEKKFKKFIENNYKTDKDKDIDMKRIYMDYISSLFTTFPKTDNIKSITNIQKGTSRGLKIDNPFASNIFTYLNVNGTPHTVSRVVIYDDNKNDKTNKPILDEYEKYTKWHNNAENKKIIEDSMSKNMFELINPKSKNYNLYNLFLKKSSIEKSKSADKVDKINIEHILTMLKELIEKRTGKESEILGELNSINQDIIEIKNNLNSMPLDEILKIYELKNKFTEFIKIKGDNTKFISAVKNIYEIVRDINMTKSGSLFNKKIISSQKISDLKSILKQFVEYAETYELYDEENFDSSILKYDTSRNKELKPFVKFIKMIDDKYKPNFKFKLSELETYLDKGTLYDISRDESFDSVSLRIHIDLIKGKVNAENQNNVTCYFNDNDLKERWDKLMNVQVSDEELEYLPYFDIDPHNNKSNKKEETPDKKEEPDKDKKGGKTKTKRKHRKNKRITRRK
jgi:hypothetical protein